MYVVRAIWPKVKSDKEKLELKTVLPRRSKCIIPRTAHIPTVNLCSSFCVNYSDISWSRLTVIMSRCCDCRLKIHIRSTGKPTFSRRDSTDDELWAVTVCQQGTEGVQSKLLFKKREHASHTRQFVCQRCSDVTVWNSAQACLWFSFHLRTTDKHE